MMERLWVRWGGCVRGEGVGAWVGWGSGVRGMERVVGNEDGLGWYW